MWGYLNYSNYVTVLPPILSNTSNNATIRNNNDEDDTNSSISCIRIDNANLAQLIGHWSDGNASVNLSEIDSSSDEDNQTADTRSNEQFTLLQSINCAVVSVDVKLSESINCGMSGHTNQILVDCIGVVSAFDADHVVVKKEKPTTDQDPEVPICSTRNSQVMK
ncbi:hypothetical protein FRACYDRAFT_249474 [Fragilariopsis cylindrus CCMP1102]|uniref:Uncharacterized protein n=1 Tax=Fragilariopsis cylindrus CCMP1102 TaxID=635003 RepID=A0A1E7ERD6_9STRA|nr:hypothetical protein FRACYDRAFT_249474 [Fragilariopsis cylindrus CCMP1102]|eukprot:OEU08580.1 hypothetical protein FRACYDRAFT_249474 [Fragilariopsis cylindrus CCMP1102]